MRIFTVLLSFCKWQIYGPFGHLNGINWGGHKSEGLPVVLWEPVGNYHKGYEVRQYQQ